MEVLWADGSDWLSVRQVHDQLAGQRTVAYTTVMTVLDRMAGKELVHQERSGRAFRYRPRSSRAEMTAELMRGTLDDLAAADRGQALVAFLDDAGPEELAALRSALAKLDQPAAG